MFSSLSAMSKLFTREIAMFELNLINREMERLGDSFGFTSKQARQAIFDLRFKLSQYRRELELWLAAY